MVEANNRDGYSSMLKVDGGKMAHSAEFVSRPQPDGNESMDNFDELIKK